MSILVIGAINVDIIGTSSNKIMMSESNLGLTTLSIGGVAKNIVTNLKYLNADVSFLTLIGNDKLSDLQKNFLKEAQIDYFQSFQKDVVSSTYLAVHDETGDLLTAINSMKSFEDLSVEDFKTKHEYIESFDTLVLDVNLSKDVLNYLIETYKNKSIYVDGVSQSKVNRISKVIQHIDLIKINNYELNSLVNQEDCDIIFGIKQLLKKGLKSCVVSSGDEAITYNIEKNIYTSKIETVKDIVSTMGAGDALFSGIIYQLSKGEDLHKAIEFGKHVASETLKVREANNLSIYKLTYL